MRQRHSSVLWKVQIWFRMLWSPFQASWFPLSQNSCGGYMSYLWISQILSSNATQKLVVNVINATRQNAHQEPCTQVWFPRDSNDFPVLIPLLMGYLVKGSFIELGTICQKQTALRQPEKDNYPVLSDTSKPAYKIKNIHRATTTQILSHRQTV